MDFCWMSDQLNHGADPLFNFYTDQGTTHTSLYCLPKLSLFIILSLLSKKGPVGYSNIPPEFLIIPLADWELGL